jgi:hypothetical protein
VNGNGFEWRIENGELRMLESFSAKSVLLKRRIASMDKKKFCAAKHTITLNSSLLIHSISPEANS